MNKNIFIIIIILCLVVVADIIIQNYLKKDSELMVQKLYEIKDNLQNENAISKFNELYDIWNKKENSWSIIIEHNELDEIELSLLAIRAGIEYKDFNYGYEQIENSLFLIGHIKDKLETNLKNVF